MVLESIQASVYFINQVLPFPATCSFQPTDHLKHCLSHFQVASNSIHNELTLYGCHT